MRSTLKPEADSSDGRQSLDPVSAFRDDRALRAVAMAVQDLLAWGAGLPTTPLVHGDGTMSPKLTGRCAALAASLAIVTSTGCSLEDFDLDGDGQVTRAEVLFGSFMWLCEEVAPPEEPAEPEDPTDNPEHPGEMPTDPGADPTTPAGEDLDGDGIPDEDLDGDGLPDADLDGDGVPDEDLNGDGVPDPAG